MAETANPIRVDVTNDVTRQPEEVQYAVAGLAYIAGSLISVGEVGVIAPETQLLNSFLHRINSSVSNPGVTQALKRKHPNFEQLVEDTEKHTTAPGFASFLQRLGVFDTSYTLKPTKADPGHYSLTFIGYD